MFNKLKKWLFPTEEFNYNALDRDGDGLVQEGTPFERKVTVVKKAADKKSPAKKKAPAKKPAPAKKTPAKKSTPKKK